MFQFRKRAQDAPSGPLGASIVAGAGAPRTGTGAGPAPPLPSRLGGIQGQAIVPLRALREDAEMPELVPVGDLAGSAPKRGTEGAETPVEELLGDKARRMNLVGGDALAASVEQAVRRALARHLPGVGADLANEVARSTRGALLMMLKARSKKVRGLPKAHFLKEVEASKRKIVAERESARRELEALLEELGKKHIEFRQTRETLVRETFDKGLVQDQELSEIIYQALGGADATPQMRKLQRQLTGMVLESLQRERQKAVDEKTSEHGEELHRYELRIAKLTKSLELTEEELKRIAAMKNVDPGVASIYRTIQGLNAEDDSAEVKKEMLAGIFQANLALQKQSVAAAAG